MDFLSETDATETSLPTQSHRQQYRIRSADVDPAGRATTAALVKLLQESAASDARRLGVGIEELLRQGQTWYLKRLHLRLRRTPWIGETVEVETWPAALERLHAIREYRLFFDGGFDAVEVGTASSAWLLMDVESGKPVRRLPEALKALHPETPRRVHEGGFADLPPVEGGADAAVEAAQKVLERPFPLRRADLDLNRHVNHGVFVDALLEPVPEELWREAELLELEVDFLAEATPGDRLRTRCRRLAAAEDAPPRLVHDVIRRDDGRELVRARSRWETESPARRAASEESSEK